MHRGAAVMTLSVDALKLADRLEAAGMSAGQARGTAAPLAETMTGAVATAADVAAVRGEVREANFDCAARSGRAGRVAAAIEIADLRSDILKSMIGAIGFETIIALSAP
jgi:hypothetical protein